MKWSLQQLNIAKREPFVFEETLNLSSLKEQNAEIRDVSPIHVKGEAIYSGSLLTFTLNIKGELILPCSRTLADALLPIDLHVKERFYPAGEYLSEENEENDEIHFFEGDVIDLLPAIKDWILLEIPIQIYADNGAESQAPESGEGWEFVTEEKQKNKIDPRLADLAKFFDKE